jgi:hypothetical protein
MGVDVQVSAGLTVGDLEQHADRVIDGLRRDDPRPFYLSRSGAAVGDGVNAVTLDLGAPPTGSIWQLRAVIMFGADAFTTPNNGAGTPLPVVAALYTGDSLNLSLATLKLPLLLIPATRYVPDTCMWCHPNENLVIQTSVNGTQYGLPQLGQQIGCNVVVEEWKEKDVSRSSGR